MPDLYTSTESELLQTYLLAQRTNGTPAQHEEALRAYLVMLKRHESHPTLLLSARSAEFEELLTYAELGDLARARGDNAAADSNFSLAQELCMTKVRWRKCSSDDLGSLRKRLEDELQKPYLH
jgi:hypothetical protein